ncbi:MAG: hydrogenase small subunit [Pseudomonadota bacterium]
MSGLPLFNTGVSRRGFIKFCSYIASSLALPASLIPEIATALERKPRLPVIWYSFQSCSGCTESLARAHEPTLEDLIFNFLSLDFHDMLQAATGTAAEQACEQSMRDNSGRYVLIIEGSIPLGANGAYSVFNGVSNRERLAASAADAAAIVAVGSCATSGGIARAKPDPTGARSVSELMAMRIIPEKPLVNLPGCPPVPIAISATLANFIAFGKLPQLDAELRPLAFYGHTIHDRCPRLPYFLRGEFAERFDDAGARKGWCLFKLGCKGPATHNACATYKWNGGVSFPVESGHPCLGCSEAGFWDRGGFYQHIRGKIPYPAKPEPK